MEKLVLALIIYQLSKTDKRKFFSVIATAWCCWCSLMVIIVSWLCCLIEKLGLARIMYQFTHRQYNDGCVLAQKVWWQHSICLLTRTWSTHSTYNFANGLTLLQDASWIDLEIWSIGHFITFNPNPKFQQTKKDIDYQHIPQQPKYRNTPPRARVSRNIARVAKFQLWPEIRSQ